MRDRVKPDRSSPCHLRTLCITLILRPLGFDRNLDTSTKELDRP
jgi:hypothetical protein